MFKQLRAFVAKHPYLVALAMATGWNLLWYSSKTNGNPLGLALSGLLIGGIVAANRVKRWQDVFWKFPLALACFLITAYLLASFSFATRTTQGDMDGLTVVVLPIVAALCSPILLIGEFLGWGFVVILSNSSSQKKRR